MTNLIVLSKTNAHQNNYTFLSFFTYEGQFLRLGDMHSISSSCILFVPFFVKYRRFTQFRFVFFSIWFSLIFNKNCFIFIISTFNTGGQGNTEKNIMLNDKITGHDAGINNRKMGQMPKKTVSPIIIKAFKSSSPYESKQACLTPKILLPQASVHKLEMRNWFL